MSDIKQYEPLWGSWYVDSLLGEGSFGKVYKVHKEEFGKTYEAAVKMISIPQSDAELRAAKNDGLDSVSARSYFHAFVTDIVQEIDLMSAFRGNSNIVSLEDHKVIEKEGEIGWDILIRMELLTTLSSYVTTKPMTQDDVVKLGVHICHALELCAMRKTIHRDIKPDNIFVSQYGEYKLGDFGIARQIERTMSGLSKKGTYTYMAPEVFKGEEYGASVDLYSLGIVMYRFLNKNRTPFLPRFPQPITPRDRDEALQCRMKGEPLPPIPDIDPALGDIVLKACAYDRKDRFASAADLRAALEALPSFGGTPITVAATSTEPKEQSETATSTQTSGMTETTAWAEPDEEDNERTKAVFALREEQPRPEEPAAPIMAEVPRKLVRWLAVLSGLGFGVLSVLCFLSGDRGDIVTFLPIYALCLSQCVLRFRAQAWNVIFLTCLIAYVLFSTLGNVHVFDYSILTVTLGLLSLDGVRNGERKYQALIGVVLAGYVVASALMIFHNLQTAGLQRAYAMGGVGIPLLLLMAAPLGLLLGRRDSSGGAERALGMTMGIQFFSVAAVALYALSRGDILFHVTNANFISFLPERFAWWTQGRLLGLLLQAFASVFLLALAAARFVPEIFMSAISRKNLGRLFQGVLVTVLVMALGTWALGIFLTRI